MIVAQKILSCVVRVKERFGADHVTHVLKGKVTENMERWGHQKLSTFGLIGDQPLSFIRSLIEQLIGQNYLKREPEYSTLSITPSGWQILRGEVTPVLAKPVIAMKKKKEIEAERGKTREEEWENIDQTLFQLLREKRGELARARGVPAFIIFGDRTLRDMARLQPRTVKDFASVYGVGEQKQKAYAQIFVEVIERYRRSK